MHHQQPHVLHEVPSKFLIGDVLAFYVEPEVLALQAAAIGGKSTSKSNFTLLCVVCSSSIMRLRLREHPTLFTQRRIRGILRTSP